MSLLWCWSSWTWCSYVASFANARGNEVGCLVKGIDSSLKTQTLRWRIIAINAIHQMTECPWMDMNDVSFCGNKPILPMSMLYIQYTSKWVPPQLHGVWCKLTLWKWQCYFHFVLICKLSDYFCSSEWLIWIQGSIIDDEFCHQLPCMNLYYVCLRVDCTHIVSLWWPCGCSFCFVSLWLCRLSCWLQSTNSSTLLTFYKMNVIWKSMESG